MASYNVKWKIDVEAETPKEAAILALEIQQDIFSEALVYEVTDEHYTITAVDLLTEETE